LAPRVGLAWTFLPNTVFRAGYGLFFAPGSGGIGFESGRSGQRVLGRHERLLRATAGSAQYTDPRASLANPFVTGLLPYPNSLVGNGIGAIFPSWATP